MPSAAGHDAHRALQPPNLAIENGFATSNSTINYFLGTPQRAWMSGNQTAPLGANSRSIPLPSTNRASPPAGKDHQHDLVGAQITATMREENAQTSAAALVFPQGAVIPPVSTAGQDDRRNNLSNGRGPWPSTSSGTARNSGGMVYSEEPIAGVDQGLPPPHPMVMAPATHPESPIERSRDHTSPTIQPQWGNLAQSEPLRFATGPSSEATISTTLAAGTSQRPHISSHVHLASPSISVSPRPNRRKRSNDAQMTEQPKTRPRPEKDAAACLPQVSDTHIPPAMTSYVPALEAAINAMTQSTVLSILDEQRIGLLRRACVKGDHFYLFLHQVFCLWSAHHQALPQLGFGPSEEPGFRVLECILLSNHSLSRPVMELFMNFPSQPVHLALIFAQIKTFLGRFEPNWNHLRQICLTRRFPPLAGELYGWLAVPSPILQQALFNSLHRQVSGGEHEEWYGKAVELFERDQEQFVRKLSEPNSTQPAKTVVSDYEVQEFGRAYTGLWMQNSSASNRATAVVPSALHNRPTNSRPASLSRPSGVGLAHSSRYIGPAPAPAYVVIPAPSTRTTRDSMSNQTITAHPFVAPRYPRPPSTALGPGLMILPHSPPDHGRHIRDTPPRTAAVTHSAVGPPSALFLPPPDRVLPVTTNPNPNRMALHQAHVRSPKFLKLDITGRKTTEGRVYQYLEDLVMPPQLVDVRSTYLERIFTLSKDSLARRVKDLSPTDQFSMKGFRVFAPGSVLFRLRCVQRPAGTGPMISVADYAVQRTTWPPCCFVSINDKHDVEFRRRPLHGQDLAADLTRLVREGDNVLKMSLHWRPEDAKKAYFTAIELIKVADHETTRAMPRHLPAHEALSSIAATLKRPSGGDDDVMVVDPFVSIDLVDPFMSTIWTTPVRGHSCQHRECFDLEAFLQSRTSRQKGGPTNPDEWKCPICKRDARPPSLIIDDFLLGVRDRLEKHDQLGARAILVREDGSWVAKFEKPETNDSNERQARTSTAPPTRATSPIDGETPPDTKQGPTLPNEAPCSVIALEDD